MKTSVTVSRRLALASTAAWVAAPSIQAQSAWPSDRPIKLIVPFAPGGSTDGITRQIADELRGRIGQTVVVDNRAGAGSTLGTGQVAKAALDGYSLLVSVISAFSVGSTLYPIPHLVMLRFAKAAGIELTHTPYRGGAPAVADAIGGQVSMVMDGLAAAVPHLKSGSLKGLGLTSPTRSAVLPDVPTFEEQGFTGNIVEGWAGIAAPAGTPRPILEKLANSVREVMTLPALQERYLAASSLTGSLVLDDMQRFVRADAEAWRTLVIASGATVD